MGSIWGIVLHAIGGFCAGSFYSPIKKIKSWSWESSWLVMGLFAWVLVPIFVASITTINPLEVLLSAANQVLFWTYFLGFLWGIGGPIFNLTMRYLGVSLGMTVSLGSSAAFGTLIPPIVEGTFWELVETTQGQITFGGVLLCLVGIAFAGYAGHQRDRVLAKEKLGKQAFNTAKGILITFLSGPIGACFAYGLAAGKPIAEETVAMGADPLWQNNTVLVALLLGGFTSNFMLCAFNNFKNKTSNDYFRKDAHQGLNYILASSAGCIWYLQFMFYGMGSSLLDERFHFASWTVHMSFIILFGNLWGLYFKEWKLVASKTVRVLVLGLFILALSTVLIAWGGTAK